MSESRASSSVYWVATVKPWNVRAFHERTPALPGQWRLLTSPEDLRLEDIARARPRYIFFPHWSWKVPHTVLGAAECVCFHMTDVPYGRGGSPLQNLIRRGHRDTMLSALRMADELDAGPVYLKRPLSLAGTAGAIFARAADLTYDLIADIIRDQPEPRPQTGEVVTFSRRTPAMSELPKTGELAGVYDHIRMLDAETYPKAFIEHGDFRLTLEGAQVTGDTVTATVVIRRRGDDPPP